jgi:hypothetical protein
MNDEFGVPAELNSRVFAAQLRLRGAFRDSLREGVGFGALLANVKQLCRHGEWVNWLKRHYQGSPRHAQNLMRLAKAYPHPEKVPDLSLRRAIRLLPPNGPREKTVLARERLSGEPCDVMLAVFPKVLKLIEERAISPLELEGVTAQHPAMKAAKKLAVDVRRLRQLVENLYSQKDATKRIQDPTVGGANNIVAGSNGCNT